MQNFTYLSNNKKKTIEVEVCKSLWSKLSGLMFRKESPPLLFVFNKEKQLNIHSFFCKPFVAIWLNKNKEIIKKKHVSPWNSCVSGRGKYLLEIPIK